MTYRTTGHRLHVLSSTRSAFPRNSLVCLALLPLLLSCSGGSAPSPSPAVTSPPADLSVSAPAQTVATNGTVRFTAATQNAGAATVTWHVDSILGGSSSVGTIDSVGLYRAPAQAPTPATVTVSAALASNQSVSASAAITVVNSPQPSFGIFSWRNDAMLSGVNSQESVLTPASVSTRFGKLFSCPVDGHIYAQPLYAANISIPEKGLHNVVFVATAHNSIYAFDADATPCRVLWHRSLINPAAFITPVPSADVGATEIAPEIGITGTPVIDPATATLYVVASTKEPPASSPTYFQRLHAIDITTGADKPGGVATIAGDVAGTGDGSDPLGRVNFDPVKHDQRAGLQLAGSTVYVAYGGHGTDPFHGWLFGFNAATLGRTAVLNLTPDGSRGGIGRSGAAPSVGSDGSLFVATGAGTFDPVTPRRDYAQTLLRLASGNLTIADFFAPFNQLVLTAAQPPLDWGATGVLLLPDEAGSLQHRNLAIVGSAEGFLYLLDRDSLGGYTNPPGPDDVVAKLDVGAGQQRAITGTPAFWQGTVYVTAAGHNLNAYSLSNATLATTPRAHSAEVFGVGPSPVVSSNGAANGIVWLIDTSGASANPAQPAVLFAYDASNLNRLYSSAVRPSDATGLAVKHAVPTVANGKVYVGSRSELTVYGLLP